MVSTALCTPVHLMTDGVLRPAIAGGTSMRSLNLQPEAPPSVPLKEPISNDMAIMLDDIQRARERDRVLPSTPTQQAVETVAPAESTGAHHEAHEENKIRRKAHHVMTAGHLLLEGAEMTNILGGAYVGGIAGCAALSLGMFAIGTSHIAEAYREKSVEQLIEGTGASLLGVKAGLMSLHQADIYANHSAVATVAHATHSVLAPLGVAHGVLEAGLGGYRVYEGVHTHDSAKTVVGLLGIGLGCSMATAVLGGGVPAMVVASTFFAGKVLCEENGAVKRFLKGHDKDSPAEDTPAPSVPLPLLSSWRLYT